MKFLPFVKIARLLISFVPMILIVSPILINPPKVLAYANPAAVPLGTVDDFAALAATAVSSPITGTVLQDGNLGVNAGCTDFPAPCTTPGSKGTLINGVIHNEDATATTGQTDATAAVTNIGLRTADTTLVGGLLGGQTLTQGVYEVPAAVTANITGDLTLSGDADSIFIFHATSTLVTATGSRVLLTGGVQACNVFWKVDSSATFNGTTTMVGTVLASTSITFPGGGATVSGRVVAQTGAITFNNTAVNNVSCAAAAVAAAAADDTDDSDSDSSSDSHDAEEICVADRPPAPQWSYSYPVTGGMNLVWSAMGGSQVGIEITNSQGEYEYKYAKVANTGHLFLPNVTPGQLIRIRVLNICEYGDWLSVVAKGSPGLPATGFAPI